MAAQGLVERRALAGDRRSNALFLTAEGRALTQKGMALQRSLIAATLGALPGADVAGARPASGGLARPHPGDAAQRSLKA